MREFIVKLAKKRGAASLLVLAPLFLFCAPVVYASGIIASQLVDTAGMSGAHFRQYVIFSAPTTLYLDSFQAEVDGTTVPYGAEIDAAAYTDQACTQVYSHGAYTFNSSPSNIQYNAGSPKTFFNETFSIPSDLYPSYGIKCLGFTSGVNLAYYGDVNGNAYYVVNGESSQPMATSTSVLVPEVATSSAAVLCNSSFATSTGFLDSMGSSIANAFCDAGVFLFIPSSQALSQYGDFSSLVQDHFPFSWIDQVQTTWNGLSASSTANMPEYDLQLGDLGIGSSSPMGDLLPNFTLLSTSTVTKYAPSWFFPSMKGLASVAIILGLVADIFFSTKNELRKH